MSIMPRNDTWEGATAQQVGAYALYALASPVVGLLRVGVSGYYLLKQLYVNDLKPKFNKAHREAMKHLQEGTLPGHEAPASGGAVGRGKQLLKSAGRKVEGAADELEARALNLGRMATGTDTRKGWKQELKRGLLELTLIGGIAYAILEIRDNKKPEEFAGVNKVGDLIGKEMAWSQGLKAAKKAFTGSSDSSSSESEGATRPSAAEVTRAYRANTKGVRARHAARKAGAGKQKRA